MGQRDLSSLLRLQGAWVRKVEVLSRLRFNPWMALRQSIRLRISTDMDASCGLVCSRMDTVASEYETKVRMYYGNAQVCMAIER
jgi:hypothetical protein